MGLSGVMAAWPTRSVTSLSEFTGSTSTMAGTDGSSGVLGICGVLSQPASSNATIDAQSTRCGNGWAEGAGRGADIVEKAPVCLDVRCSLGGQYAGKPRPFGALRGGCHECLVS